jgi:hypothetical protein
MNPHYRKIAVFVGAAALAGGAGVGLASQGSADATDTGAPMSRPGGGPPGMYGTLPDRPRDGSGSHDGTPPAGAPPGFGPPDGVTPPGDAAPQPGTTGQAS